MLRNSNHNPLFIKINYFYIWVPNLKKVQEMKATLFSTNNKEHTLNQYFKTINNLLTYHNQWLIINHKLIVNL